nr:hypothetical protein [Tanacetum cinerariifolium]
MSTPVFADPKSSTQADGAQSSRVHVPLPEDPYEAIRQAYLVGMNTESEPFEDLESETPKSPHIVAPPHVMLRSHRVLARPTTRMAVRVPPVMSPGLFVDIAEVAAMPDLAFRKRFGSFYDSSPSPTLPVQKRYRGTSELIWGIDSEEINESSDSDSESKDAEDEGPTAEDEDPVARDEGLVTKVEGPGIDDERYGLDDESHGVDDESHGLDDEGDGIESDRLGLGEEEEVVHEGQQQAAPV